MEPIHDFNEPRFQANQATKRQIELPAWQVINDLNIRTVGHIGLTAVESHVHESTLAVVLDAVFLRLSKKERASRNIGDTVLDRAIAVHANTASFGIRFQHVVASDFAFCAGTMKQEKRHAC
ncbi:MAG: hypothetical protein ACC628_17145 [Pirellulaceae bacterium]